MRFQVPQFIDIEDKVVGPLSFRQFVYLAGGAGLSFILYSFLPLFIAFLLILPVAGLSLALAFYKVNNRPFIETIEHAFKYASGSKLYVWKKVDKKTKAKKQEIKTDTSLYVPRLSESKLKDLAWSLDIHDADADQ